MPSFVRILVAAGALALLTWSAGLIAFAGAMPTKVADSTTRTDAIVVLTGGRGRIEAGLDLLQQGYAGKLFVSGAGGQTRLADLVAETTTLSPETAAAVSLGREAEDTPGNAVETSAWVAREGVTSIRLVTAAYHMPRSLLEMHAAMPQVTIIAHPVFPSNVMADWWRYPGTASLFAREYIKVIITRARITLSGPATEAANS
jgi:uncharacterized SAM-binding protein YcdF (DUF218 family)